MNFTPEIVWSQCLQYIKDNIQEEAYEKWFVPIRPMHIQDNVLTIQVPTDFFYEFLETHYVGLLKKALHRFLGKNAQLMYDIKLQQGDNSTVATKKIPSANTPKKTNTHPFENNTKKNKVYSQLNPKYNFDSFVKGGCNELSIEAGLTIAKEPGKTAFNPCFIYSGIGLGKTHLVNAIGLEIEQKYPEKQVLYVSMERFIQQFMGASRENKRNDFIHFYHNVDVLIVDDIQFLSGKEGTQKVFFEIFNYLHQNGKQVILTSDKAPTDMQDIEERLISRFKWALVASLTLPNIETRIEILKRKLEIDGIEMPQEVVAYLAKNIKTNIRDLEGGCINLIARASLVKTPYTIDLAKQVIRLFVGKKKHEITTEYIIKTISEHFNVSRDLLNSKKRQAYIVRPRQIAMYFAKQYTNDPLASIGNKIGKRNHATVLHSCKIVENLKETNKKFRKELEEISYKFE